MFSISTQAVLEPVRTFTDWLLEYSSHMDADAWRTLWAGSPDWVRVIIVAGFALSVVESARRILRPRKRGR